MSIFLLSSVIFICYSGQEVKLGQEKVVSSEQLDLGTVRLERGSEAGDQV